jgi:parvulin-like peptidyl-prolyl isomerase
MYINGEFVDDALVRLEAVQIKQQLRAESPTSDDFSIEIQARDAAREMVIERILLSQSAKRDPTPVPPFVIEAELQKFREQAPQQAGCLLPRDEETLRSNIENELRMQRFLAAITAHIPKPTNKQVAAFYQFAKQSLTVPENIHAAHIVKNVDESTSEADALAAIQQIQSSLQQGVSFEQLADEQSDCPGRGGDLGFFTRGEMVAEFDAAVFDLPAGSISDIFRTPFGFHIAKVYERRAARIPTLNEVRPELEESILRQTKIETIHAYMRDVRAQADIRKSK